MQHSQEEKELLGVMLNHNEMKSPTKDNGAAADCAQDAPQQAATTAVPEAFKIELVAEKNEEERRKEAAAARRKTRELKASCVQRAGSKVSEGLETLFYK